MKEIKIITDESFEDIRIDKLLAITPFSGEKSSEGEGMSRSFIKKLIDNGSILVNGKAVKASFIPKTGDEIVMNLPEAMVPDIEPENIPLDIAYEDDDVIVINKPKGMVVHPAAGNYSGTVVNALMFHCRDNLSGINGVLRPGIVHRIDKDTTGLIVVAKNDTAHRALAEQLKEHSMTRRYQAICMGSFKESEGKIEADIGRSITDRKKMAANVRNGKPAVTHYRVLKGLETLKCSHIECVLETGRTHQIRVHMAYIGHPLLGDFVYGPFKDGQKVLGTELHGQCLHAGVLGFIHPTTGKYMEFEAPLPDYFKALLG
ncbi:MAG: RluA family pseudouridine synthase [Lachnospiraceae bacterium]|nr:RluA family pseudouridine synthase [Lachnospiraceae bacterium]